MQAHSLSYENKHGPGENLDLWIIDLQILNAAFEFLHAIIFPPFKHIAP